MTLVVIQVMAMVTAMGMVTNNRYCECERSVIDD